MAFNNDSFKIGNKVFTSRLMLGTGKYPNLEKNFKSIVKIKTFLFLCQRERTRFAGHPTTSRQKL